MQQPSIKTPGSIWAKLIDQNAAQAKKPEGRGDAFVYVVGPRGAGKSTLLNRFLYPNRADAPKPSEGLEYTYARRPSAFDHEKKDLAHFWEIGSGAEFMDELACADKLFLTAKEVANAVLVVTVDLSDPAAALPALLTWLDLAQRKLTTTYHKFEKRGLQLPEHLRIRAKNKLYASNEDKDVVRHTGIAIVIAATKYDALRDKDPELKKVVGRTLRYIAHANGAFLTYLSGLHGGSPASETGKDTALERALLDNFTKLMNHLVFTGLDKKPSLKTAAQTDHAGPLWVPAGSDRFRDIGWPRGGSEVTSPQAGIQEWRAAWERLFPPKEDAAAPAPFVIDDRYREEEVDAAAARKLQEAEAQRKELERGKEATKRRSVTEGSATAPVKDSKPAPGVVAPPPPAPAATVKKKASSSSKAATGTIKAG